MEIKPFRVAFRAEGEWINVYLAALETMEGALLLASLRKSLIRDDMAFAGYKDLMRQMVGQCCADFLGAGSIRTEEEAAPEHERAGHG